MALAKATHKPTLEIVANPRTEKNITPKQEEFAKLYVCEDISQTEAAVRAGYSVKSAHAIASQLLNGQRYPHVVARIGELKAELAKGGNFAAAVAAEKSRGQAAGLYIDRKEILHGKIDQMDREQVMKEIQKLQKEFPALAAVADGNLLIEGKADDKTK